MEKLSALFALYVIIHGFIDIFIITKIYDVWRWEKERKKEKEKEKN